MPAKKQPPPTVGRIVHVQLTDPLGLFAAIVTGVVGENTITATVFLPSGELHADAFTYYSGGESVPPPNTWHWPVIK